MRSDLDLFLIKESKNLFDVLQRIDENARGVVFIVYDTNVMVGVMTDGDVRRLLLRGAHLDECVSNVMNKEFVSASVGQSLEDIYTITRKNGSRPITYIPILDSDGRVVDYFHCAFEGHVPMAKPSMRGNEFQYVAECLVTNWISSQGRFVKQFEDQFSRYIGTQYAVATSNGTTALHLAISAYGIGPGDEVIVPTLTFIATANAVTYAGATPVFVDSDDQTWGIDPACIAGAITERTKAIIPVHLYGQPSNMDDIVRIAKEHNLLVIEDVAEAHGATHRGRKTGSIGDAGCFSFFGNKIITTGEGGMVVTNDEELCKKMQMLRDHGMSKERRYWHPVIGFNYRLTNIQAAIGCAQLERIDEILREKDLIKERYNQNLSRHTAIILPPSNIWARDVCWAYSFILDENKTSVSRNELLETLTRYGIECRPLFYPIHTMPPYYQEKRYPVSERLSRNGITLPSYVGIRDDEIDAICAVITKKL